MKLGDFELAPISAGHFWLDGGAMYGPVPKVLWNKLTPADEDNRVRLSLNCLLIKMHDKKVLVDTGLGEKLSKRMREIYKTEENGNLFSSLDVMGVRPPDINFVINTHLHFDHCGGNTIMKDGKHVPAFPNAKYVIQREEWLNAIQTNEKTRSSYRSTDFLPIEENGQLLLIEGDYEITPGVRAIVTSGHTRGHQSVLVSSKGRHAIYLGDLIPTAHHLKLPYMTGFELYPLDLLKTKKEVIARALAEKWLLIFEHDPEIFFANIAEESGGLKLIPV